jgi:hypothetical protein
MTCYHILRSKIGSNRRYEVHKPETVYKSALTVCQAEYQIASVRNGVAQRMILRLMYVL